MKISAEQVDKTNFIQSLMHMIKGHVGTGILAMPAAFNHCGLINSLIELPILCLIAGYCTHLLVRSSRHIEKKMSLAQLDYAELARGCFQTGPNWVRPHANFLYRLVYATLLVCQLGICCVYLVFIVDNLANILTTFDIVIRKNYLFLSILPVALLLCYIRTLRRLAIASACANLLQVLGLGIVLEFLIRPDPSSIKPEIVNFKPASEVALGFGSAMFAFEGICVVLPIYARMKHKKQMGRSPLGIINITYFLLLSLSFIVGTLGYLRFGSKVADSITLNMPKEPIYEMLRAIYAIAVFLSYPLQFHVANEVIWNWARTRLVPDQDEGTDLKQQLKRTLRYEYLCRTLIVLLTFLIATSIPKLNLMMDFFGSVSGTALTITLPALIHTSAFWHDTAGAKRWSMVMTNSLIIVFGIVASINGAYFSFIGMLDALREPHEHANVIVASVSEQLINNTLMTAVH